MRCPNCGGERFDIYGTCLNDKCHYRDPRLKPPPPVPPRWRIPNIEPEQGHFAELKTCPSCKEKSLEWNPYEKVYECLNKKCPSRQNVSDAHSAESEVEKSQQLPTFQRPEKDVSPLELTAPERKLAASGERASTYEQTAEILRAQLSQAEQTVQALQVELDEHKSSLLHESPQVIVAGELKRGHQVSVSIELRQFEELEGEIRARPNDVQVSIQNTTGSVIRDFGTTMQYSFLFIAETPGRYAIVIKNSGRISKTHYNLTYRTFTVSSKERR